MEDQNTYQRKTTSNFHFPGSSPQQTPILVLGFIEFPYISSITGDPWVWV